MVVDARGHPIFVVLAIVYRLLGRVVRSPSIKIPEFQAIWQTCRMEFSCAIASVARVMLLGTLRRRHSSLNRFVSCCIASLLLLGVLVLTPGCGLLRAPSEMVSAVVPGKQAPQQDLVDEQIQLQRFADDFLARSGQALDDSADRLGTDAGRAQVLRLKLISGSSLLSVVSGPNPGANLLDLVSVTVLNRKSVEDYWMKTTNGAAFQPWLEAGRVLETNVWNLAARFLQPTQVVELRLGIEQWYGRTPEVRTAFFARPHEFASMVRTTKEKGAGMNSVFTLVNLDPTAGLDPAVREVTRTRLFAERAMFTMQRMPFLLRLQTELLAYELTAQPAFQSALSNSAQLSDSAGRISRAAESISESVARLPDRLSAERKEILAALELQENQLHDLVVGIDRALISGKGLSDSLSITVTNVGGLMKQFGVGEPTTNAVPDNKAATNTNSQPFSILDYAKTAGEADNLVKDLNVLVASLNQSTPGIQRLSQQTVANAQTIANHIFRLGLALIAVSVVAGLLYTFLAQKLKQRPVSGPKT